MESSWSPLPGVVAGLRARRKTWRPLGRLALHLVSAVVMVLTSLPLTVLVPPGSFVSPGTAEAAAEDLDPSFDGDGIAIHSVADGNDFIQGLAFLPGGDLVAAGWSIVNSRDVSLARINPDGSLDTGFGVNGKLTVNLGTGTSASTANDEARAVAVDGDGRIVAAGTVATNDNMDFLVARFTSTGVLDTTFDTDGWVATPIGAGDEGAWAVAIDTNAPNAGKIVVAGGVTKAGAPDTSDFALVRYNADGSLDTSFGGGDGMVTTDFNGGSDAARAVVIDGSGRIVVAGFAAVSAGGAQHVAVARYDVNGTLDATFGTGGKVNAAIGDASEARAIAFQSDGKIVVAGSSTSGANTDFLVARYSGTDGSVDTGFNGTGVVLTDFGGNTNDEGRALALQTGGMIVVAGCTGCANTSADFAVARYTGAGALDVTFSGDGKVTTDLSGSGDVANAVAIQADGNIVAAGHAQPGATDFALVRYLTAGAALSNNADLSALALSAGTLLTPAFAANTTAYTASVPNATASLTVTPTADGPGATIQVRVNGGSFSAVTSGSASGALALNVGANPVEVKVTAQDGNTVKTYTVTVTRSGDVLPGLSIVSGDNQAAGITQPLAANLSVLLRDASGNADQGRTVSFTVAGAPANTVGQQLSRASGVTGDSGPLGTTEFGFTLGDAIGVYTARASIDLNSDGDTLDPGESVVFTATATGVLSLDSGNNQTGPVSQALTFPLLVALTTSTGAGINGRPIAWAITGAPAGATGQILNSSVTSTGHNGTVYKAEVTFTLGNLPGTYTVTASIDLNKDGDTLDAGETVSFTATSGPSLVSLTTAINADAFADLGELVTLTGTGFGSPPPGKRNTDTGPNPGDGTHLHLGGPSGFRVPDAAITSWTPTQITFVLLADAPVGVGVSASQVVVCLDHSCSTEAVNLHVPGPTAGPALALVPNGAAAGERVAAIGTGFTAGAMTHVMSGTRILVMATPAADGSFVATFVVPAAPAMLDGNNVITAGTANSTLNKGGAFTTGPLPAGAPSLTLGAAGGLFSTTTTVAGSGFFSGENLDLQWDDHGATVPVADPESDGAFAGVVSPAAPVSGGFHTISARSAAAGSGRSAAANFAVTVPAGFTVNSATDAVDASPGNGVCETATAGQCTLRAAIQEANVLWGPQTLTFAPGINGAPITLTIPGANEDAAATGDLDITGDLTITGNGPANTIIQAGSAGPAAPDGIDRVFHLIGTPAVTISGVTIRYGNAPAAGGGGIYSSGAVLNLSSSRVTGNTATAGNGGGINYAGTGAYATITNSAIDGNAAPAGNGGGIHNSASTSGGMSLINSTLSGNTASGSGGGIADTGILDVFSSTVAVNTAATGGGISFVAGSDIIFKNSLFAGNVGGNCAGTGVAATSSGYNLSSDASCTVFAATGDQNSANPNLGLLQNNGGPTPTHALPAGSPAVDAGDPAACTDDGNNPLVTDQRGTGFPRAVDGNGDAVARCDIGAFEFQVAAGLQVHVMSSGNATADQAVLNALTARGHSATLGVQPHLWDGSQANLAGHHAVVLLNSHNWNGGEMPAAGQAALVSYVSAGGRLVTGEWLVWKDQAGLNPMLPVTVDWWETTASTTYTQATADSMLNSGLPASFSFPLNYISGAESTFIAKAGAMVFYNSSNTSAPGVVGWSYNLGRVISFSTFLSEVELADANYQRLFVNAVEWAGQGASATVTTPTKLAILKVTPPEPVAGETFAVTVQAQDNGGALANVATATTVYLTKQNGAGTFTAGASGMIPAGQSAVTITGLTYSQAEVDLQLRADDDQTPVQETETGLLPGDRTFTVFAAACVVPPADMVSWWPGDGNANDIQGGNHGTPMGGAAFGPGMVGQAFSLDGVNDYVEIPDSAGLTPASLSLDAWVKPDAIGGMTIASKYDANNPVNGVSWALLMLGTGKLRFTVHGDAAGTSSVRFVDTNDPVMTAGAWQHVAATFDAGTQAMKIYRNGVEIPSTLGAGSTTVNPIYDSSTPVRIGVYTPVAGGFDSFWDGLIDEVELFNRALSAAEVQALYNAGSLGKCRPAAPSPTKLAITNIDPAIPVPGQPFSVTVQAQTVSGQPANVSVPTPVYLTKQAGTGTLGGNLGGSIAQNTHTFIITGVIYGPAEAGVVLRVDDDDQPNQTTNETGLLPGDRALTVGNVLFVATTGNDLNDCVTAATACRTIGGALGKAADGALIVVAAGTYSEAVTITRAVTVQGPNAFISPMTGTRVPEAVWSGTLPLITIGNNANPGTSNVTIQGFTFTNANAATSSTAAPGIIRNGKVGNNVTIRANIFTGNQGRAIFTTQEATPRVGWMVTDNVIENMTREFQASMMLSSHQNCTITNNVVRNTTYGGIQLGNANNCVITGNTVENVKRSGIQVGYSSNVVIENNSVTNAGNGPAIVCTSPGVPAGCDLAQTDDLTENGGITLYNANQASITVRNNLVAGSKNGLVVRDDSVAPNFTAGADTLGSGISFPFNSVTGSVDKGADNRVPNGTVDVGGTWWGSASGPQHASNAGGTGQMVSDRVSYSPWLGTGTDAGTAIGFQPAVPMTWKVGPQVCVTGGCIVPALAWATAGDTVNVAAGVYTESLTVDKNLTINGAGAASTIIQAAATPGTAANRVVAVQSNTTATISGVTIRNGQTSGDGGGILNRGSLSVSHSTISGNTGGLYGGGISTSSNSGTLSISNSTVSGNTSGLYGGGIHSQGTVTVVASSTITANTASSTGYGGGIYVQFNQATIKNTIIAGNSGAASPNCSGSSGGTFSSGGYNLLGNTTGCTFPGATGDQVGTGGSPINPLLGPLQDNGGPTQTHALLAGSPAIDGGNPAGCTDLQATPQVLTTDQRGTGFLRSKDGDADGVARCDIGAFELQSALPVGLVITGINPPSPTAGQPFSVTVQARDGAGSPTTVAAPTTVYLSKQAGAGTLGGALLGQIALGEGAVVITGVILSQAGGGVVLRADDDVTPDETAETGLLPGNSDAFAVVAQPVRLTLSPAATNVAVNTIFTVDVLVDTASRQVNEVDAFLDFNPARLQVVDANGNPVTSIAAHPNTLLPVELQNGVDNAAGRINFGAGKTSCNPDPGPCPAPPSGAFPLATVRFKALAPSPGTAVRFSTASPRPTGAYLDGVAHPIHLSGSTIGIKGVTLGLVPPLRTAALGEIFTVDLTADAGSGAVDDIDMFLNFDPARLRVVDAAGVEVGTIVPHPASPLTTMDNRVDNVLGQIAFSAARPCDPQGGACSPAPSGAFPLATIRFKPVAPSPGTLVTFNRAGTRPTNAFLGSVSVLGPFTTSAPPVPGADLDQDLTPVAGHEVAIAGVTLRIDPPTRMAGMGEIFTVSLKVDTGLKADGTPQEADEVDAFLDFDPTRLQVVDAAGNSVMQIEPDAASPLKQTLLNQVDNTAGRIGFSAGRRSADPAATGIANLATIRLKAIAPISSAGTAIVFSSAWPRVTAAFFQGNPVTGPLLPGLVQMSATARALVFTSQPVKGAHSFTLGIQPAVVLQENGATLTTDSTTVVTLRIKADTGTPGAALSCIDVDGNNKDQDLVAPGIQKTVAGGVASFTDCKIDLKGQGYVLEAVASGVAVAATSPFNVVWAGDVTGDCLVDIVDFSVLARSFGKQSGNIGYDGRADLNGDNKVDTLDFSVLVTMFGTRCAVLGASLTSGVVTVTGSGHVANKQVTVTLDGAVVTTAPTPLHASGTGGFTATFTLPGGTGSGLHVVKASQQNGRVLAAAIVTVP